MFKYPKARSDKMIAAGYLSLIKKFILVWNYALQDVTQDRFERCEIFD